MRSSAKTAPLLIAVALIALGSVPAMAQSGSLNFKPSSLVFCTEPGQGISEMPISITTSSGTVQFTSADATSAGNWLTITPTTGTVSPAPIVIFAVTSGISVREKL